MEVLVVLIAVSMFLASVSIGLFVRTYFANTFDYSDRLALLPLRDDEPKSANAEPPKSPDVPTATKSGP